MLVVFSCNSSVFSSFGGESKPAGFSGTFCHENKSERQKNIITFGNRGGIVTGLTDGGTVLGLRPGRGAFRAGAAARGASSFTTDCVLSFAAFSFSISSRLLICT